MGRITLTPDQIQQFGRPSQADPNLTLVRVDAGWCVGQPWTSVCVCFENRILMVFEGTSVESVWSYAEWRIAHGTDGVLRPPYVEKPL